MDSLALLCNLYGDGPATLRRLREAGLGSLEVLESAEPERLAGLLRTSVRAARRFQAEAHLLRERAELAPERAVAPREAAVPERPSDPLLRRVLDAWRRMDDEELLEEDQQEHSQISPSEPAAEEGAQVIAPAATTTAGDVELRPGVIEGLSAEWITTLKGQDVRTLADLAGCDALEVSRKGVLAYTRLLRLQLLARRERLAAGREAAPLQDRPHVDLSPAGHATPEDVFPEGDRRESAPDGKDLLLPRPPAAFPSGRGAVSPPAPQGAQPPRFSPTERPPAELPSGLHEALLETLSLPARTPTPAPGTTGGETLDSAGPFA